MKKLVYILLLFISLPGWAEQTTLEDADNSYMQEHYEDAVTKYEAALQKGVNADAFYNLGNAYYRLEDMGKAVLNYERALLLAPDHEDASFNLEICKSKMIDQFNKPSEMFFITWIKDIIYDKNADQWGKLGIIFFTAFLFLFGLYKFGTNISLRKIGFFAALICFIASLFSNIAASFAYYTYRTDHRAVVIKQTEMYKSSNKKEDAIRALNPGTTVNVLDGNSRGWYEIELPNGKVGWVQQQNLVRVKE